MEKKSFFDQSGFKFSELILDIDVEIDEGEIYGTTFEIEFLSYLLLVIFKAIFSLCP